MANKDLPDNENTFAVDAPDVEGADGGWDDWDEVDVDVESAPDATAADDEADVDVPDAATPQVDAVYEVAEASDEDWGDDDWGNDDEASFDEVDVDVPAREDAADEPSAEVEEAPAEAAPVDSADTAPEVAPVDTDVSSAPTPQDASAENAYDEVIRDALLDQEVEELDAQAEAEDAEPAGELQVDEDELRQYLPPEPPVEEETVAAEPAEPQPTPEEENAALDEALAAPVVEKSAEELQREQEELEAYRSAMGESNAEMADVSEYRTFRKKTKTESKSSVPKKSDFDLFANRYKVKTMNAMVAASDPIVYFYNACLRADGSIVAFNVYQVLQDRFLGKMVPQLFTAVAENSNKIEDLNEANLIEQLKTCAEYPQYDFIISISARFFTKPALLDRFLKLVPEGGAPNLVLAFDCSSLENIAIAAKAGLGAVRQKGVKILLDNTERVTMTVLSEFDYDIIRIDSRYYEIGNPRAEAYLRLLLQLTKEQGVTSIATFCDSEDLSEYMFFMGVDAIQGNATSRPMRTVPNAVKGITLLPSMLDS